MRIIKSLKCVFFKRLRSDGIDIAECIYSKHVHQKHSIKVFFLVFHLQTKHIQPFPFGKFFIQYHGNLFVLIELCYKNKNLILSSTEGFYYYYIYEYIFGMIPQLQQKVHCYKGSHVNCNGQSATNKMLF